VAQPARVLALVEDAIVLARKRLDDEGLDHGAQSILWWLDDHRSCWQPPDGAQLLVPSRATIHRVLVRRGQVSPMPQRRPRRSRRFVRPAANDLWQIDGYETALADGTVVVVIEIMDDHSRQNLACHAAVSENGDDAWVAFCAAADRFGLPYQFLSDNGSAFSGARRGWTSALEARLGELGVVTITAAVNRPQTCGKVERGHKTARRWLHARPAPATIAELQDLLERYRHIYNNRRHQSLGGMTPQQAWTVAPRSGPAGQPLPHPLRITTPQVSSAGSVGVDGTEIGLGKRFTGATATVFRTGDQVTVFIAADLIREITLDRSRRYQPQP
jgi:transposase InsO family protein